MPARPTRASRSAASRRARRRRTTSRTSSARPSPRRPASTSSSRRRPGTRCTTRRSRTWRPIPASMTSSISSRTSSTAISSRNFLVDITKTLDRQPEARRRRTSTSTNFTYLHQLLQGPPRTAISSACRWRPSSRSISTARTSSRIRRSRPPSRPSTAATSRPAKTHKEYQRHRRVLHRTGARRTAWSCGAPRSRRIPAIPSSWYEFFESVAPTFGVYNWGIDADNNYAASVANGGKMNGPEAKAALTFWLGTAQISRRRSRPRAPGTRSPRRSPPAAPRRAWSMARTPPGSPPTPTSPRSSARSAWRCRRSTPGVMDAAEAGTGLYRLL